MVPNDSNCNGNIKQPTSNSHDKHTLQRYNLNGIFFRIVLSGDQTNGTYSVIEVIFPANRQDGISMHKHSREDVMVYVIEGGFIFKSGKEEIVGEKGTTIRFEKETPHSYVKISNDEGRLLVIYTPAGFESFFEEIESSHVYGRVDMVEYDPIMLQLLEKRYGWRLLFE